MSHAGFGSISSSFGGRSNASAGSAAAAGAGAALNSRLPPDPNFLGHQPILPSPRQMNPPPNPTNSASSPQMNENGEAKLAKGAKARSSMACTACRRGKMRCEGPPGPCKRCRANGKVDCTFEMGVGTANRAARAIESTGGLVIDPDERNSPARAPSMSASPRPITSLVPSSHSHEQRLASLESELAMVKSFLSSQFNTNALPPNAASPGSYSALSYMATSPGSQQPWSTSQPPPSQAYPSRQYQQFEDETSRRMTVSSGSSLLLNPGPATLGQKRGEQAGFDGNGSIKRGRIAGGELDVGLDDFIERGEIAEDEARLCFDSYLATLNTPPSPEVPQIDMSFAKERQRSPLLLATLVAIGARAISHTTSYSVSLREATRLARLTVLNFASPTDLKALMLLSCYTGQSGLCGLVAEKLGQTELPMALLRARDLPEQLKGTEQARVLVRQGRTFLVFCIWAAFYTFNLSRPPLFPWSAEVLIEQTRVLRESPFSEPTIDLLISAQVEMASFSYKAFAQLGDGIRVANPTADETIALVEELSEEARMWAENNREAQALLNGWGDEAQIRQVIPFHHIRLNLVFYSLKALEARRRITEVDKAREHVRLGIESALLILRFATESRLWLPHSSSAQYYRAWKTPETLRILFRCVKLMPEETHFDTIRGVLERFGAHLDRSMTPLSTAHEVKNAHEMRILVAEFQQFLDSHVGGPRWTKDPTPTDVPEEDIWNDESLEKSLALLRLDTALYGCVFLDDE